MLIDTHCHLNIITKDTFDTPLNQKNYTIVQEIIEEAESSGVKKILNIGTSLIESINSIELAKKFQEVYAAIGIHPNDLKNNWKSDLSDLKNFLDSKDTLKIKAIGECGLDYHYPDYNIQRQKDGFKAQVELALEYNLPLVIHTRDAHDETLRILETFKDPLLRGVIHCFSEDISFAYDAIDLGFFLGMGGSITYPKNEMLRNVIKTAGLEHIILETDAPFLPPQPMRGKKNYPKYIKYIAEYISELLNITFNTVAQKTTANAQKLFKL